MRQAVPTTHTPQTLGIGDIVDKSGLHEPVHTANQIILSTMSHARTEIPRHFRPFFL